MNNLRPLLAATALLLAAAAPAVHADTSAAFIDGTDPFSYLETNSASNGGFDGTLGWEFSVNAPTAVTALGYFDDMGTGSGPMTEDHDVGLFTLTGTELASATVTPTDTADGLFRFTSITPVVLLPGVDYLLGGVAGTDNYAYDIQNNSGFDPNINFLQDAYDPNNTSSLTFPTASDGDPNDPNSVAGQEGLGYAYFGPNFQFTPAATAVPEASSLGLLGLALLPLGMLAARRRARAE